MPAVRLFSLDDVGDDLIDSYSHGMEQKTSLTAVLMHDPTVLVFDESTVGLAPKSARLIKGVSRQFADRGSAVAMTTHILEIAEHMCDRAGIIHEGRLIAVGTMDGLRDLGRGEAVEIHSQRVSCVRYSLARQRPTVQTGRPR